MKNLNEGNIYNVETGNTNPNRSEELKRCSRHCNETVLGFNEATKY
jgi:hypothetical protein